MHEEREPTELEGGGRTTDVRSASPPLGLRAWVWSWAKVLSFAFVLFLLIRAFAVEAFRIPTSSMENTLLVGDFLLVNKAAYGAEVPGTDVSVPGLGQPRRGDVIVFNPPHEPEKNYVKRLVGVPGDTLAMREKRLFLNGRALEEPYARYIDWDRDQVQPGMRWQRDHLIASTPDRTYRPSRDTWGPIVVPEGRYFVLGDNRDNSEDSRYWGFVPREAIHGRPWIVYYSYEPDSGARVPWLNSVRWSRIGAAIR